MDKIDVDDILLNYQMSPNKAGKLFLNERFKDFVEAMTNAFQPSVLFKEDKESLYKKKYFYNQEVKRLEWDFGLKIIMGSDTFIVSLNMGYPELYWKEPQKELPTGVVNDLKGASLLGVYKPERYCTSDDILKAVRGFPVNEVGWTDPKPRDGNGALRINRALRIDQEIRRALNHNSVNFILEMEKES